MKWKLYKESEKRTPHKVGISCNIKVHGDSPEDAIRKLQDELTNIGGAVSATDGEPDTNLVEKYNYWDEKNEGDVMFSIYKSPESYVEICDGRYML